MASRAARGRREVSARADWRQSTAFKIHQRGVQWKQGVAIYMMIYTSLLCNTTPIHCTPLPLHPPVMNTHACSGSERSSSPSARS